MRIQYPIKAPTTAYAQGSTGSLERIINSELPPQTAVTRNGMPNLSVTTRFANRKIAVIAAMAAELVKSRFVAKLRISIKAMNQIGSET